MLCDPSEHASYNFKELFTILKHRGHFQANEEFLYTEEYLSILVKLRRIYPKMTQPTLLVPLSVELLCSQLSLRTRYRLSPIFRLSRLCLDEPHVDLPTVKFGCKCSNDFKRKLVDVILQVQLYLANVIGAVLRV